jgi:hypothetical protein
MNNPLVDQIISSYRVHLKWSLVSRELNIEPTKLYRIRKQYDIDKIFEIDDDHLLQEVTKVSEECPMAGRLLVQGHFRAQGIKV